LVARWTNNFLCEYKSVGENMSVVVIKYGGNAMKSLALRRAVAQEIAQLRHERPVVVVHGGGPVIEQHLARLGIESQFLRGLRVTSPAAMEVIEATITTLSKHLAQDIGSAVGLSGRDAGLLLAQPLEAEYGRVGRVVVVNIALLEALLKAGYTPVVGCIAQEYSPNDDTATDNTATGDALNINADWAAGAVAGALAAPLVYLSDVAGVMRDHRDPSTLAAQLTRQEVVAWISDGTIAGGMIPKVEAALHALDQGAPSATIASGMQAGVLAAALAGTAGTRIVG
jgi:acetylglutamate kinase